jgi:uncharacterized protein
MTFEWDENKNRENRDKHDVSFNEAQYAFFDKQRIILKDEKHSQKENRYFCIGKTENGIVTVRFSMRKENIRIFGAGFWRTGRKLYEKKR